MVNRVSTSGAAFLALLGGCFVSVNPAAIAGDKIEFSAASDALAVPRPERSVSQDTASAIREVLSKHHGEGSDFNGAASGNYVTIVVPTTTTKSHDHFGWTAPFEQTQDQDSDSGLDMFSEKKTTSSYTNSWSVLTEKDSSSFTATKEENWTKDANWAKGASWAQPDHGLARFSVEESLKSGDQGQDWLSRRFNHHASGEDWSRGFGSHEDKDPVRSGYESSGQSKEDFGAFYKHPFGRDSQADQDGADDYFARSPISASKSSLNDWSDGALRNHPEQQLQTQPSIAETFDQLPTAAHPSVRKTSRDQTFTAPIAAPNAPAVLPFPQRPGSLFQ